MLITAHMLALRQMIAEDLSSIGVITNATIDKISSFSPPPISSDWSHWFKITLYGKQFLTLISRCGLADYPGKTAYHTETRQPSEIDYIGELKEDDTLLEPQTEFDKWNGKKWVTDKDAIQATVVAEAE